MGKKKVKKYLGLVLVSLFILDLLPFSRIAPMVAIENSSLNFIEVLK